MCCLLCAVRCVLFVGSLFAVCGVLCVVVCRCLLFVVWCLSVVCLLFVGCVCAACVLFVFVCCCV